MPRSALPLASDLGKQEVSFGSSSFETPSTCIPSSCAPSAPMLAKVNELWLLDP